MTESWIQVITIIGANLAFTLILFLWLRAEANAERRQVTELLFNMTNSMLSESKDFHGRLCAIEERNKGK